MKSLNFTSPTPRNLSASEEKSTAVVRNGEICTALRPHKTAAKSCVVGASVSNRPWAQVMHPGDGPPGLIFLHSLRHTSNCMSDLCSSSTWPVIIFKASLTCTAATTLMIGIITPAVSQVGALAAGGGSSKTHRKQAV